MKSYLLKIRGGVEVDSQGKKAGKGPLIQEEKSATLGVSQDQYLFQAIGFDSYNLDATGDVGRCLSTPSGGLNEHIPIVFEPSIASREGGHIYEGVSGTLRAKMGDNQMAVAYGVTTKGNGDAFINLEKHTSLTVGGGQAGQGYPCVILENHPADSRVNIDNSGKCQTLTSRMGTGGGNVPMVMFAKIRRAKSKDDYESWGGSKVTNTLNTFDTGDVRSTNLVLCMATQQGNAEILEDKAPTITAMAGMSGNNQPVVCLEGNGSRPSHRGDGYKVADEMFTLNTTEVHSVCYGICSYDSNAMRSANPSSGIYEAATSRTLDLNGGNPACNQGGMVVIEPKYQGMILDDITPKHSTGDIAFTTRGTDYKRDGGLCVVMSYQKHTGPLMASGYAKNGTQEAMSDMFVVEPMYWDGSQTVGTLTANNAGGNQRMPDKNHFQCVLQPVASFYPQMKAESQCYREDGVANTLVNGTNPEFQNGVVVPK